MTGHAHLLLASAPEAASAARSFLSTTLFGWGRRTAVPLLDVVVSELVTNAVRHGAAPIELLLIPLDCDRVRITVIDHAPDAPPRRRPDPAAAGSGYGLNIVDKVSEQWGYDVDGAQKAVWADVDMKLAAAV